METLSLFPKLHSNFSNAGMFKDGYVLFPLNGFSIKLTCGRTIMNCMLRKTIHLPDYSRNTHNWSKVHGPCGNDEDKDKLLHLSFI